MVLDVAREFEPDALNLKAVGQRLGVTGPAIYRYFPDRAAILDALADEARERLSPPSRELDWEQWLVQAARKERALWKDHTNLYEAANYRAISRPMLKLATTGLDVLIRAGFTPEDAYCGVMMVSELAHTVGWAQSKHAGEMNPPGAVEELIAPVMHDELPSLDRLFELSLQIQINGLRNQLKDSNAAKSTTRSAARARGR